MHAIDKYWLNWLRDNEILQNTNLNSLDELVEIFGWPSERSPDPYFDGLQHVIDDYSEAYGVPIYPPEVIAYLLSEWTGSKVTTDHPLVRDNQKWLKIFYDSEFDMASPADSKQLYILVRQLAKGELLDNLGDYQDVVDYHDSPDLDGKLCMISINEEPYWLSVADEAVAFMDIDKQIKVFSYDGERLYEGQDLPKIRNYIVGGMRLSHQLTDTNELASLIGNKLASLVIGEDGISILDLP